MSDMTTGIPLMEIRLRRGIYALANVWDGIIEAHMKINAPWTDRTTAARSGLAAKAFRKNQNEYGIIMTYNVHYGKWLELCNQRRYGIIVPTLHSHGPQVLAAHTDLLDRIGG